MPQPKRPAARAIKHETTAAWWCPFDDHANMQLVQTCGGCGAVRDGDKVKPPDQFTESDEGG
jgi:hypothetical protein